MSISQYRLAKDISVPAMRINKTCNEKAGISTDTALRLARYFGTSSNFGPGSRLTMKPNGSRWIWATGFKKKSRFWSSPRNNAYFI